MNAIANLHALVAVVYQKSDTPGVEEEKKMREDGCGRIFPKKYDLNVIVDMGVMIENYE